jgi:hypothetical protein
MKTPAERAMYDIKMTKAFERGQYDSHRGRPMCNEKKFSEAELRRYIEGYHSMQERKAYG